MKSSLFLALGLAASLGAAGGPVAIYSASQEEMYKYAFPEGGSTVVSKLQGTYRLLDFSLKGDVTAGGGIGVNKLRLKDYLATGALELYAKGAKGGEKLDVGFVQAKGMDANQLAFQVLVPLSNYGLVGTGWTKFTIPLRDFPAQGSRWIESEQRSATGAFDWDRVSEFVISHAPGANAKEGVTFTNIRIVPSYNAGAVAAARPKAGAVSGTVVFYAGKFGDGGGPYAYPNGKATLTEVAGGHSGKSALKASLQADAWSGAGIVHTPVNLSSYRATGVLELWLKGAKGGEEYNIGLTDKATGASVRVLSSAYAPGGIKTGWTRVQIPLKDFPKQGSKWDEATKKNVAVDFDWTKVGEVVLDNNGPGKPNANFLLDDVAVKPAP
jgi:hypothetical protein